ncbi:hypothetical protein FOMPIDRAFT_1170252 [Fomitopsis schrenkii]|uniref:DNA-directed RNA polymerase III subunit RPC6 n=1 Tax=Fomitopsis schrenkii TaxID=2126942 RepID=S8DRB6_FOMSC|nr:hypothetical protein FOMPIDRAFT_1170252 [Fomitopsis schrenkii]
MSSSSAGRKPNVHEQKVHQAALADSKKSITPKEIEALIPDGKIRMESINFLLATGLLKAMKDTKGNVSFRAVMKKEMEVKKDMSGEESMVLSHIQASGNEGIWTKHLKAKTELHQTVIDRCLKSLTQKQLIKAVKSVKYPTRKIYMLYHLDPSVEMTGGPWYTDNELDTEFIKLLCSACIRFIRDRSLPKLSSSSEPNSTPLYPIGSAPSYPTAAQVLSFLRKSRITETTLDVEHVEMLLGVLVLDGEVERLPAFGAAMWESNMEGAMDDDGSDDDTRSSSSKKRKRKDKDRESSSRKRKRAKRSHSGTDSDSDGSESEDDRRAKSKSKSKEREKSKSKSKSKRRSKVDSGDDSGSESESEEERKRKKKKGKHSKDDSDEESDLADGAKKRKRSKSRSKKRKSYSSDSESDASSSSSRTASSDAHARSRSKTKLRAKARRSLSPALIDAGDEYGAHVYRAVRTEFAGGLGLAQAPCTRCPTFDFCKTGGPVNAGECVYYGEWLSVAPGGTEREDKEKGGGVDAQGSGVEF